MNRISEETLEKMLATPSDRLTADIRSLKGDILVLGAGGKMGPSLALLAKNALNAAQKTNRVIAVSRFTDNVARIRLEEGGVEVISCDLLEDGILDALPEAENILYMAGRKFGTGGSEHLTWAMNARLPVRVCDRYKNSRIVVFSSGNIYPFMGCDGRGATESTPPEPKGEYAMSCLARERMFEYASVQYKTPVVLFRLNYALDLRYGVLYDIAEKIAQGKPVPVSMTAFNCIWQGDANETALRCLFHAASPPLVLNVTGGEVVRIREAALIMAGEMGAEVLFEGTENDTALLSDATKAGALFGEAQVTARQMMIWQARWIMDGGRSLGKPTHFEEREGRY